jgi:oligopeptide/dipeptide ABC transporter ATP-binding protein
LFQESILDQDRFLIVQNLRKYYYSGKEGFFSRKQVCVKAVDGVSFDVKKGETLGLVGESGCGKSTLARCVMRLEEPTAGEILLGKDNVVLLGKKEMKAFRRKMQIIFQDPYSSLNPRKKVIDLIAEPLVIQGGLSRKERVEKVRWLMDLVGLRPEMESRYAHEFSGGQRQRIGIARVLALNPDLIVADEPLSALDVSIQAQVINLLQDLQDKFQLTYLFISHDLSIVKHISNRVAVMYLGHIVEIGSRRGLYENPIHPYSRALLKSVPVPNPFIVRQRIVLEGDVPSPIDPPGGCPFHPRCRDRLPVCQEEAPPLRELASDHWVACHLEHS